MRIIWEKMWILLCTYLVYSTVKCGGNAYLLIATELRLGIFYFRRRVFHFGYFLPDSGQRTVCRLHLKLLIDFLLRSFVEESVAKL